MLVERGDELGDALVEAGDLVGRPLFELADIDREAERRHAGPDVRAAVNRVVTKLDHPVTPGWISDWLLNDLRMLLRATAAPACQ